MFAVPLPDNADEATFRAAAKICIAHSLTPSDVAFVSPDEPSLLPQLSVGPPDIPINVPRSDPALMRDAVCHSAPDRFALLYDVLWRVLRGERDLAERASDPHVARLIAYMHSVRRDIHKMHAFLRFRERFIEGRTVYTAWFEPHHHILRRAVPFFVDRFTNMDFVIATPCGTAFWNVGELHYGPPTQKPACDEPDTVLDGLWLTYYRTTFNPARLRLKTMINHMPREYWNNMPEAALIPDMVLDAGHRVSGMMGMSADQPRLFAERIAGRMAKANIPEKHAECSLAAMRNEAERCTRCPLYRNATQTVFGDGPRNAPVVFVGEQPGDQEDLAGKPFVGPAGQLFDRALAEAGLDRSRAYVTNAVKHFKYEPRGKRRIHKKPNSGEVSACRWWLDGEIAAIKPQLVVALGATAAIALAHQAISVTKQRGPVDFAGQPGFITVHPSYLLRISREPGDETAKREYQAFVRDLTRIGELAPSIKA
ncbi:MAG: UdgX family uracil-DNA binding protein [Pseudorhodoplanes sp.]